MRTKNIVVRPPRLNEKNGKRYILVDSIETPINSDLSNEDVGQLIITYYEDLAKKKNTIDRINPAIAQKMGSNGIKSETLLADMGYKPGQRGLWDYQITAAMQNFPDFAGVICADELDTLPAKPVMGFVMNLDERKNPGSHWVACYIDTVNDKSIEYYNSFADGPTDDFMEQLDKLIKRINPPTYLKFKVNHIIEQKSTTDTCGFFAMKFLIDRFAGIPFRECTKYNDTVRGEADVQKFRKKFGYL